MQQKSQKNYNELVARVDLMANAGNYVPWHSLVSRNLYYALWLKLRLSATDNFALQRVTLVWQTLDSLWPTLRM